MHANKNLLFNRWFITGLFILILNDHFLKWNYPGWITGKLSDFSGLFILPLFLLYLFPFLKKQAFFLSALLFIFWKSPYATPFIHWYNQFSLIPITRIVDYTDLAALVVLPLSFGVRNNLKKKEPGFPLRLSPLFLLLPCSIAFMATSMPAKYYYRNDDAGAISISKEYAVKLSKTEVLNRLREKGFEVVEDTSFTPKYTPGRDSVFYILYGGSLKTDLRPVHKVYFAIAENSFKNKSTIYINGVDLAGGWSTNNWRLLRHYTKEYKKLVKEGVIKEIKK